MPDRVFASRHEAVKWTVASPAKRTVTAQGAPREEREAFCRRFNAKNRVAAVEKVGCSFVPRVMNTIYDRELIGAVKLTS